MSRNLELRALNVRLARGRRAARVTDAEADPIGALLTLIDWFERYRELGTRRHFQGKAPLVCFRTPHPSAAERDFTERFCEQLKRIDCLRRLAFVEGCRLGASPVEMSRLLRPLESLKWEWTRATYVFPEDAEKADEWLLRRSIAVSRLTDTLKDIQRWGRAREVKEGVDTGGVEALEKAALKILVANPEITVTALAQEMGYSRRGFYKLLDKMPALGAALEARKGRAQDLPRGFRRKDGSLEAQV